MLLQEFINRTGFTPSEDCYKELIEPAYLASQLDKDAWCAHWVENGGLQSAYEYEHAKYIKAESERSVEHNNCQHYARLAEDRKVEIDELMEMAADVQCKASEQALLYYDLLDYLINASVEHNVPQLAKMVKDRLGMRRYIARKMDLGHVLDDSDREYIRQLLNNE